MVRLQKDTRANKKKHHPKILRSSFPKKWTKCARTQFVSILGRCLQKILQAAQQAYDTTRNISKSHLVATLNLMQLPASFTTTALKHTRDKKTTFTKCTTMRRQLKACFPYNQIKAETVRFSANVLDVLAKSLVTTSREICTQRKCKLVIAEDVRQASWENEAMCVLLEKEIPGGPMTTVLTERTGNSYILTGQ